MLEMCVLLVQCYIVEVKVESRDAAMARCNVESRRHPPGKYYDWDGSWDRYYRACMFAAGYVP